MSHYFPEARRSESQVIDFQLRERTPRRKIKDIPSLNFDSFPDFTKVGLLVCEQISN